MSRTFFVSIALCLVCLPVCGQSSDPRFDRLGAPFKVLERAERAYRDGKYTQADKLLSDAWKKGPPGTEAWQRYEGAMAPMLRDTGINMGNPPCYSALRMLTECTEWRIRQSKRTEQPTPIPIQLTVLLVARGEGNAPTNLEELKNGAGPQRSFELSQDLLANNHHIIHESLWLFLEYVSAITDGRLKVETRVITLDTSMKLRVKEVDSPVGGSKTGSAGLEDFNSIWSNVDSATRDATDWWWVLYPSAVPTGSPDFARSHFFTGGMTAGPDGRSPCFLIDDLWLVRKPPHMGFGQYTSQERRAYLPQWFQHEFFHHLYGAYRDFRLEEKSHQWFDRKTWPDDFEGVYEADYYAESLHKRIQPRGNPPLHMKLQYRRPPKTLFAKLKLSDIEGEYEHTPQQNDWHVGRITVVSATDGKLKWSNQAGRSWSLTFDVENGLLRTGPDCPYYNSGGRAFSLLSARDPDSGEWTGQLIGFEFDGGKYHRKP